MVHTCPRCGYNTKYKNDMKKHLMIDKICNTILSDDNLVDYKKKIFRVKDRQYCCEYCEKEFSSKLGWKKHEMKCKELTSEKGKIEDLEKKIHELENMFTNMKSSVVNNNTNNNTINIQVNNNNVVTPPLREFGKENMMALNKQLIGDLFLDLNIPDLLKALHCDPEFPENHNIRIKSVKRKAIEIYRGNKWDIVSYLKGLNEYILQGHQIFKEYYNKNKDTVKDEMTSQELTETLTKLKEIEELKADVVKVFYNDLALMLESLRTIDPNKNHHLEISDSDTNSDIESSIT